MISIKKAVIKDLEDIIAIEQQVFNTDSYPPFAIRQLFDISGDYFLVAKDGDKTLGYVIGGLHASKKKGWVLSLGVHADGRGKGLGEKLTRKLIDLFNQADCKEIGLIVYPDNAVAIRIYKKLGFEGDQVLDNYFFDNEKRIEMTLIIAK